MLKRGFGVDWKYVEVCAKHPVEGMDMKFDSHFLPHTYWFGLPHKNIAHNVYYTFTYVHMVQRVCL